MNLPLTYYNYGLISKPPLSETLIVTSERQCPKPLKNAQMQRYFRGKALREQNNRQKSPAEMISTTRLLQHIEDLRRE